MLALHWERIAAELLAEALLIFFLLGLVAIRVQHLQLLLLSPKIVLVLHEPVHGNIACQDSV